MGTPTSQTLAQKVCELPERTEKNSWKNVESAVASSNDTT